MSSARLSAPESHDYLTVVGPPPLRFQAADAAAPARISALPPLDIPKKEAGSGTPQPSAPQDPEPDPEAETKPEPNRPETTPNKPKAQESAQAAESTEPAVEPETKPGRGMAGTQPPVDAKMLLKYFQKNRESGSVTGVTAPMGFMPPQKSPSSQATYSSNP